MALERKGIWTIESQPEEMDGGMDGNKKRGGTKKGRRIQIPLPL
jgi:hypothetical protein